MAGEYRRGRGRKKIKLPTGEEVWIPVLTGISLVDPRERYQEHQYSIDNSAEADRVVHVDDVFPTVVDDDGNPTDDPPAQNKSGTPLKVERIDTWKVLDPRSRYQESHVNFDNITGNDTAPPRFTQHAATHIYRYFKDPDHPNDDGPWIDSELIDELAATDPRDRYQETRHTFNNPTNAEFRNGDLSGQASQDDPDVTIGDGEGTEENPVRLDPFQNIVNFNGDSFAFALISIYAQPDNGTVAADGEYEIRDAGGYEVSDRYMSTCTTKLNENNIGTYTDIWGREVTVGFSWESQVKTFDPFKAWSNPLGYSYPSVDMWTDWDSSGPDYDSRYPGYKANLSATMTVYYLPADGPFLIGTEELNFPGVKSTVTVAAFAANGFKAGSEVDTYSVDLSTATMSIDGVTYHPVAMSFPLDGHNGSFSVLFKSGPPP